MSFITEVVNWYHQNKRDLPWRNTKDPYVIWLSEIILQQTRVDQGMHYFQRFLERFPTVSSFASAEEDEILKLWQGLGYYSRGRNMHFTAQKVMEEHGGYFPKSYDRLITLRGIGEYTAAAISSFSADEPRAVVDGNVFRLLARYFGIEDPINSSRAKKLFTDLANELIDKSNPAICNQAVMEFGSLQCRPRNPDCGSCPLKISCIARIKGLVHQLPVKAKKQPVKDRFFNYIVACRDGQVLFNKRGSNDIWQNLYEFPLIETTRLVDVVDLLRNEEFEHNFGADVEVLYQHGPVKHLLSHQRIFVRYFIVSNFKHRVEENFPWFYIEKQSIESFPVPKVIFDFLKKFHTLV